MKKYFALLFCVSIFFCFAAEIGGAVLPDKEKIDDTELILNGAGLRKKLVFKVYAGGLYLKKRCSDAEKIITSDEPMQIKMVFIHKKVPNEKLIAAWNEGFEKYDSYKNLKLEIDKCR